MMNDQLHVPTALAPGKSLRYPLDRKLGGHQSRSGRDDEERNSLPLPGIVNRSSSPRMIKGRIINNNICNIALVVFYTSLALSQISFM